MKPDGDFEIAIDASNSPEVPHPEAHGYIWRATANLVSQAASWPKRCCQKWPSVSLRCVGIQ